MGAEMWSTMNVSFQIINEPAQITIYRLFMIMLLEWGMVHHIV